MITIDEQLERLSVNCAVLTYKTNPVRARNEPLADLRSHCAHIRDELDKLLGQSLTATQLETVQTRRTEIGRCMDNLAMQ